MKFRPLNDRMLVKRLEEPDKSKGGIIIPDAAKERPMEGKVISVGNGRLLENGTVLPLEVKAGDTIVFQKYGGCEVDLDGERYVILKEEDVLGIVQSPKEK